MRSLPEQEFEFLFLAQENQSACVPCRITSLGCKTSSIEVFLIHSLWKFIKNVMIGVVCSEGELHIVRVVEEEIVQNFKKRRDIASFFVIAEASAGEHK